MTTTKNLELKHLATKNEMEENIIEDHQTETNKKKKHKGKETMEIRQYQKKNKIKILIYQ